MPRFQVPPPKQKNALRLGSEIPFAGINLKDIEMKMADGQSPVMQNVNLDDRGTVTKRRGLVRVLTASMGSTPTNGMFEELFYDRIIFTHSTKIYSYEESTETLTELKSGLANAQGFFYTSNDVLFYKNGTDFIQVASNFTTTNVIGYIPTITISRAPTGGGTPYEQKNLIQAGFIDSFSGGEADTAYTLSYDVLDATAVTALVNNVPMNEGAGFSVNRTTGIVTFTVAPGAGTNNVLITAYKTIAGDAEQILKCIYVTLFGGGTNDTRVLMCGNPDYKNAYWYTDLTSVTAYNATYFPELNFNRISADAKYIYGFAKFYDKMIILKEEGIYTISYAVTSGEVSFPVTVVSGRIGCDMPGSIAVINNNPIFCNTKSGMYMLVSTVLEAEKNLMPISGLINGIVPRPGLLFNSVSDLRACSSVDDGRKFYLRVNSQCWVWDYEISPYTGDQYSLIWYYYTNINALQFGIFDRELYFCDRSIGQISKFFDGLNDYGLAIEARWRSKMFDFGLPDFYKSVPEIRWVSRLSVNATYTVTYMTETGDLSQQVPIEGLRVFDWEDWDWEDLVYDGQRYPDDTTLSPTLDDIRYFQIDIYNNNVDENLSILDLVIDYIKDSRTL